MSQISQLLQSSSSSVPFTHTFSKSKASERRSASRFQSLYEQSFYKSRSQKHFKKQLDSQQIIQQTIYPANRHLNQITANFGSHNIIESQQQSMGYSQSFCRKNKEIKKALQKSNSQIDNQVASMYNTYFASLPKQPSIHNKSSLFLIPPLFEKNYIQENSKFQSMEIISQQNCKELFRIYPQLKNDSVFELEEKKDNNESDSEQNSLIASPVTNKLEVMKRKLAFLKENFCYDPQNYLHELTEQDKQTLKQIQQLENDIQMQSAPRYDLSGLQTTLISNNLQHSRINDFLRKQNFKRASERIGKAKEQQQGIYCPKIKVLHKEDFQYYSMAAKMSTTNYWRKKKEDSIEMDGAISIKQTTQQIDQQTARSQPRRPIIIELELKLINVRWANLIEENIR